MSVACGNDGKATDHDSTLDVGTYSTQPLDSSYDDRPSYGRGVLVESLRLGARAAFGSEIAPEFSAGHGGIVLATEDGIRNADGIMAPAMAPFHPMGAFITDAAETPYVGEHDKHYELSIGLVSFPDEQSATDAAVALAQNDLGMNGKNELVGLPDYPAALSHWRPGVPNLGSWMAWKSVVIAVFVQSRQANLDQLTAFVSKAYQQQLAKLDGYVPVARDQLPMLKLDQDKLLTRLVKTNDARPDQRDFAVYSPRGFAGLGTDPVAAAREYGDAGVKAIAVSDNKYLYDLRDTAAARDFTTRLAKDPTISKFVPMAGVPGAADISCFKATQPNPTVAAARRFRCVIPHEEVVAEVFSTEESDVRQLAAAQYTVLKGAG
ncbi:hypothetical protein ACFVUS_16690 [Nocardia sp. NPDC058058]|uniref:DUF7373 family lipoprotein n=1 Tax=Nocardia sp. NPDC058058 TaxID=3346317 RepID=UPI0036DD61D4